MSGGDCEPENSEKYFLRFVFWWTKVRIACDINDLWTGIDLTGDFLYALLFPIHRSSVFRVASHQ